MKILIIEDDEDDALILTDAIENVWPSASYKILKIHGPWKSHMETIETAPNLIFIDAFSLSGKECLKQLNGIENSDTINIVVYTDESRPREIDEFRRMGADHILMKTGNYGDLKISLAALRDE